MREQERRYRSTSVGGGDQRARYQRAVEKQAANSKNSQMTYDDYLESVKDAEKLIELDYDTKWDKFRDFMGEYFSWMRSKKEKYAPIAKQRAIDLAKKGYQKQPVDKEFIGQAAKKAQERLRPLNQRFGAKNVMFGGLTGITVLVLGGGLLLFRGSPASDPAGEVESAVDIKGGDAATPTFNVAVPDNTSDDRKIIFDPTVGVASYRDEIDGVVVTVSQQPLTDEQKIDKESALDILAVQLLADISFDSDLGKVYITTPSVDEGDKTQVAVFMTEELLLFVRTAGASLRADTWLAYINNIVP